MYHMVEKVCLYRKLPNSDPFGRG
eukprot:COSAG02_NODE_42312_length_385_cov_1.451049_1_plen_23_part_01